MIFNNKLTVPEQFKIKQFKAHGGFCQPLLKNEKRTVIIEINQNINDKKTFLEILAHEMVHQYQWEILNEWHKRKHHGKTFWEWEPKLKYGAGLTLSLSYSF